MPSIPRELKIVKYHTLYKIIYSGGGQVPDDLKGAFTTYTVALECMAMWRIKRKADAEDVKKKSVVASRKAKAEVKKVPTE